MLPFSQNGLDFFYSAVSILWSTHGHVCHMYPLILRLKNTVFWVPLIIFPLCHLIIITYSSEDDISINQYVVLEKKHEHSGRASNEVSLCVSDVKALFWMADKITGKFRKVYFQTAWFRLDFFQGSFYEGRETQSGCSTLLEVSVHSKLEYSIVWWLAVKLEEMDSAGICHKLLNNEVIFINMLSILISLPALFSGRHLYHNLPESVSSLPFVPKQGEKNRFWK